MGRKAIKSLSLEEIVNDSAKDYGLDLHSHLNLYLISNGLVPAGYINFHLEGVSDSPVRFNDGHAAAQRERKRIKDILTKQLGLCADLSGVDIRSKFNMGQKKYYVSIEFSVSTDKYDNRDHLYAKNTDEFGIASGFPLPAVLRFCEKVNGKYWIWDTVKGLIGPQIRKDPKSHLEKAYLMWVPEGVDSDTGELSPASKELCVSYMDFVRKNNPKLAKIVENDLLRKYS